MGRISKHLIIPLGGSTFEIPGNFVQLLQKGQVVLP